MTSFIIEGNVVPYESGRWFADAGIDSGIPVNNIQFGYDKVRWLKAHAEQTLGLHDGTTKLVSDGRYLYSDLHHWHEAAKEHIIAAREITGIK